jgi:hypothetical protein
MPEMLRSRVLNRWDKKNKQGKKIRTVVYSTRRSKTGGD